MANLQDLPQELFDSIFQHCSRDDLRACHLTSRVLHQAVRLQLFREIHLSLEHRSWEKVQCILADNELRDSVQELVVHPDLLPEFADNKIWQHCVDIRPFQGKFYYDMLSPKQRETWIRDDHKQNEWLHEWLRDLYGNMPRQPDDIQAVSDDYFATMENQKAFFDSPEFFDAFRTFVCSFPQLQRLRDAPWYKNWFGPPFVHQDGNVNKISWYLDMLKHKEYIMSKSEDLERVCDAWDGLPVAQSFILRAGTFTSRLFLHAIDFRQGYLDEYKPVSELDMCITLVGQPLESERLSRTSFGARTQSYWDILQPYLGAFSTSDVANLTKLRLTLLNGESQFELKTTLRYLCALSNTARSLTSVSLHFRTTSKDFDYLAPLDICKVLHLQAFELDGAIVTEQSLGAVLRNHAITLRSLSLNKVRMLARKGTWSSILKALPSFLSLQNLKAHCLVDTGAEPGLSHSSFIGPDPVSLLALQAYVRNEGPWLGLTSVVEEPGLGRGRPNTKGDPGWDWSGPSWPNRFINPVPEMITGRRDLCGVDDGR